MLYLWSISNHDFKLDAPQPGTCHCDCITTHKGIDTGSHYVWLTVPVESMHAVILPIQLGGLHCPGFISYGVCMEWDHYYLLGSNGFKGMEGSCEGPSSGPWSIPWGYHLPHFHGFVVHWEWSWGGGLLRSSWYLLRSSHPNIYNHVWDSFEKLKDANLLGSASAQDVIPLCTRMKDAVANMSRGWGIIYCHCVFLYSFCTMKMTLWSLHLKAECEEKKYNQNK